MSPDTQMAPRLCMHELHSPWRSGLRRRHQMPSWLCTVPAASTICYADARSSTVASTGKNEEECGTSKVKIEAAKCSACFAFLNLGHECVCGLAGHVVKSNNTSSCAKSTLHQMSTVQCSSSCHCQQSPLAITNSKMSRGLACARAGSRIILLAVSSSTCRVDD